MLRATTRTTTTFTKTKDIAEQLGVGIGRCSLVIIEGESKSGKSVLSQHFAYSALLSKKNAVAYYTTGNTENDVIAQMDSLSLNATHYLKTDRLRIYPLSPPTDYEDAERAARRPINQILELPERFNLIIVDSITPFMAPISLKSKINWLIGFKMLCNQNRSLILVANSHISENGRLLRAYIMSDCDLSACIMSDYYLRLKSEEMKFYAGQRDNRVIEVMDNRVVKTLEVLKLRGFERQSGKNVRFEIRPGVGILPA